ncbi:hypothetical protein BU26DRAFT_210206 [Trematosphaeria pertusa]|uniref:Uncharacterized protein n=1 Tax=Trematosphaeria pertusa TaxID=390896 RepID=A0A6A6IRX1_9PLEO|nr:uncharacterized protein BU26DRAFT_210206 [Trematosphaeria pertusa]KAF2252818.1 hypothetical protein BU26DRAFT_210206 [Trematosphaeria pertusa]
MVIPKFEASVDPLGSIPELPATERNAPFATPDPSRTAESSSDTPGSRGVRHGQGAEDHVLSWAQYHSLGNRNPSSRLSQPHGAPDASASVWGTMGSRRSNGI